MRWLYSILIVLIALIGIAAFYPGSAALVRRQLQLLTGYSLRQTLLPRPPKSTLVPSGAVVMVITPPLPVPEQQDFDEFRKRLHQLAAQYPDDAQIQFVHNLFNSKEIQRSFNIRVIQGATSSLIVCFVASKLYSVSVAIPWLDDVLPMQDASLLKALQVLRKRFPNDAGVLALLIHYKMSELVLRRDRTEKIFYKPLSPNWTPTAPKRWSNPEGAARLLASAREGERLEPQNGFFTLMRAIALLEMGRDGEAAQALIDASRKPLWNSYKSWASEAYYKAVRLSWGWHRSTKPESGHTLLQFRPWRFWEPPAQYVRMARLFVGLAATHEKRGEWRKGVAIRVALAHSIARMRAHQLDINTIENYASLFRMVALFPAERASPPVHQNDSAMQQLAAKILREYPHIDEVSAKRWGFFLSELRGRGFVREAEWFERELLANQQTLTLTKRLHRRVLGGESGWEWERAIVGWRAASLSWSLAGALCLWLALLAVLGGGLLALLQRLRLPEGVIMPLLFALAMLGVLSFVLSDAGTRIVMQIIDTLRQAQRELPRMTGSSLKQQLITWLPDNPYAIQIGLGVLIFVSLLGLMLLLVLLQPRRVASVMQSVQSALWVAATGLAVLYLATLLGYFRTQAHFIEAHYGYLLGGREYIMRVVGEPVPLPSPPPLP